MRKLTALLVFGMLSLTAVAQQEVTVSGTILDADTKQPLEYATIAFYNPEDNSVVTGGITDMDGNYSIPIDAGTYNIEFEFISYKKQTIASRSLEQDTNLGTTSLALNVEALDAVEVIAETTTVDIRLDKKIYNIGKDLTTQGATVSDALANVPSVTVDVEGAIALRGNENVRILINGKPSAMAGFGDTNIFQQLPADAIERVEVITSPSARYDAEGTAGILNIILRKEKTLGLNGSFSFGTGLPENHRISSNLNLRTEKFNIFNTTGVYYRKSPGNAYFENNYFNADEIDRTIEDREMDRRRRGINTNLGIEYYLTESSSFTASVFGRLGDDEDVTTNNSSKYFEGSTVNETLRRETEIEKDKSLQFSMNYMNNFNEEGHKLTADFQYSYDNEDRPTTILEEQFAPSEELIDDEKIFETEKQNEFLAQVDYVLPMGEAQFEAGYRGTFEEEITDYNLDTLDMDTGEYVKDLVLSNAFTYNENVNALYTQYGNKMGKFSFLLGLRLENTQLKGQIDSELGQDVLEEELGTDIEFNFDKNYLGLFPTVNLIYELGEDENISLGYNRRINRPRGWFINPFPSRDSGINVFQGNPDLNPAFSNAFDLGYLKQWEKLTFSTSVYYQHETESFSFIREETGKLVDGVPVVRSIPINLATQDRFGGEFSLMYNPAKWLRTNGSFNIFKSQTRGDFNDVNYDNDNTSWFARFSSKVTLPATIQWQTTAFYRGPSETAISENEGIFSLNMAMSKDIVKDKATLTFNVSDLLNSRKRKSYTVTDTFSSNSEFQWRQRQFTLSFIYRFNQPNDRRNGRDGGRDGMNGGDDDFGGGYQG